MVDVWLEQLESAQPDAKAVRLLEECRELLRQCRDVGIARAFAEQAAGEGPAVPPAFADDQRTAQEAEQRYLGTGDRAALDSAAAAWSRMLEHAAFSSAPEPFRLAALNNAGVVFLRRYWACGRVDDLKRALDLWEQAVKATPPDSPDLPIYLSNLGGGLSVRFARTGREADLEEAIRVFQQAVEATPPDSPDLPNVSTTWGTACATGLSARGGRRTWKKRFGSFNRR